MLAISPAGKNASVDGMPASAEISVLGQFNSAILSGNPCPAFVGSPVMVNGVLTTGSRKLTMRERRARNPRHDEIPVERGHG